jgi:hypothetical protein
MLAADAATEAQVTQVALLTLEVVADMRLTLWDVWVVVLHVVRVGCVGARITQNQAEWCRDGRDNRDKRGVRRRR